MYVAGRLAGKSKKQAAKDAGYADSVAKNPGQKLDRSPGVRKLLLEAFTKAGITRELLAKVALAGLRASVVHHETQYSKREVHVDFKERREMLKLIGQFEGSLVEKHEVDAGPTLAELLEESFRG